MIFHNLIRKEENGTGNTTTSIPSTQQPDPGPDDTGKADNKDKVVVMQGPLSTIYTDALNKVYAQESQAIDAVTLVSNAQQAETQASDLYVYVSDAETINNSRVAEVFDNLRLALDNRKGNAVVVLESNGVVSQKLSLIDNFARSQGARVVYSRKVGIETIKTCLESMRGK